MVTLKAIILEEESTSFDKVHPPPRSTGKTTLCLHSRCNPFRFLYINEIKFGIKMLASSSSGDILHLRLWGINKFVPHTELGPDVVLLLPRQKDLT